MSLLTLGEAKSSRLSRIAGVCPDSEAFLDLVNDGTRMLMRRGNWWGTVQPLEGCVYDNCITWPREAGTIEAVNLCGAHVPVKNQWYQFTRLDSGMVRHYQSLGGCGQIVVENDGTTPVFQNIPYGTTRYIRAYPNRQADVGKSITIFGTDNNGQTLMTARDDGSFQEGVQLTLAMPYVSTVALRTVTRVLKDETEGVVRLYQYDAANDVLYDCAVYQPSEVSPDYLHSRIRGYRNGTSCNGLTKITALVKLAFVPAKNDQDLVLIENLDALAMMMQSIKTSDAYDHEQAEKGMLRAIHEMNMSLRDHLPIDEINVRVNAFGTAQPSYHRIGQMM